MGCSERTEKLMMELSAVIDANNSKDNPLTDCEAGPAIIGIIMSIGYYIPSFPEAFVTVLQKHIDKVAMERRHAN